MSINTKTNTFQARIITIIMDLSTMYRLMKTLSIMESCSKELGSIGLNTHRLYWLSITYLICLFKVWPKSKLNWIRHIKTRLSLKLLQWWHKIISSVVTKINNLIGLSVSYGRKWHFSARQVIDLQSLMDILKVKYWENLNS